MDEPRRASVAVISTYVAFWRASAVGARSFRLHYERPAGRAAVSRGLCVGGDPEYRIEGESALQSLPPAAIAVGAAQHCDRLSFDLDVDHHQVLGSTRRTLHG